MRLIYTDEAGISVKEPICVVAAVLVDPDEQYRALSAEIDKVFDRHVPHNIRAGFEFHGLEVFNGGKKIKRDEWPFDERLDFFKEFVSLPFVYDLPVAFGSIEKTTNGRGASLGRDGELLHHMMAFASCMERADLFLRKYRGGNEIGVAICEDVPQHRRALAISGLRFRERPLRLDWTQQKKTHAQGLLNKSPEAIDLQIAHIIDVPHFVQKGMAPMLQLADACAFTIRRWQERKSHGSDLMLAMLGPIAGPMKWAITFGMEDRIQGFFNTLAYWNEEQKREGREVGAALRATDRS